MQWQQQRDCSRAGCRVKQKTRQADKEKKQYKDHFSAPGRKRAQVSIRLGLSPIGEVSGAIDGNAGLYFYATEDRPEA